MLKNILIPEKIGQHYLFKQSIIGLELNKNNIKSVQLSVSGKNVIKLENTLEESFKQNNGDKPQSIKNVLSKLNKYDYLRISIPSNLIIFKELNLPFVDEAKIRSILNFEIEPILPFSINDVVADFIITKQDKSKKETTIMVAIARKKDILELLEPFTSLQIKVDSVLVDIFSLYGLYISSEDLAKESFESALLIDMHDFYTNIVYIQDGQLKLIKSIQTGVDNFLNEKNEQELLNSVNNFASNISFTINSFKSILPGMSPIKNLVLSSQASQIKNLNNILFENLNIPSHTLTIINLAQRLNINNSENISNSLTQALANAYPSKINENFNLLRQDFEVSDDKLLRKQLIFASTLLFIIFALFIGYSYYQISKIKNEIANSKKQVTNTLNDAFNINDKSILKNLSETINVANNKVNEDENIWFSFSTQARFSYLKYLSLLTQLLNDPAIGLTLHSLSISQGIITIDGDVNSFEQLAILEKKLNDSNLFSHITVPQETKFTIKLTIKKNEV